MSFRHRSILASLITSTALLGGLTACGGGGGSSSSSGGSSVGSGTGSEPETPPPENGGIPTLFEASFEENAGIEIVDFEPFTVNAPGDEEPTNLALTGVDATPFQVNFSISPPDSDGNRVVSTSISTNTVFNYEDPKDFNEDNLYEFGLTGEFQGTNLNSEFKVSIIDLDDDAETGAVLIRGEAALQTFGIPVVEIPDLTGDGISELAVTNVTGKGPASAYVIESDFFRAATADVAVGPDTASGVRFTTTQATDDFTPNTLTALPQADGSGTDLMLSADDVIYVFPIDSAAEYAAIQGNVDPSTIADRIEYTLISPDGNINAQLIPDVNGDNINDIAVLLLDGSDGTGEAGIIFGVDGTGTPKTVANGFDVTFESSSDFSAFRRAESAGFIPIPDIDGDGIADLILAQRNFSNNNVFFLRSAVLGNASSAVVDLDNLNLSSEGFKLRNHEIDSVAIGQDYDEDGTPTLIFTGGHAIDGHEFAAINPNNLNRIFGNTSTQLIISGMGENTALIGDVNGDGDNEYLGAAGTLASLFLVDGATIRAALDNPGVGVTQPDEEEFAISLANFFGSNSDITDAPIYLPSSNLLISSWATDSNPQIETDPGQLIVFDATVVSEAFNAGATGVTIVP